MGETNEVNQASEMKAFALNLTERKTQNNNNERDIPGNTDRFLKIIYNKKKSDASKDER